MLSGLKLGLSYLDLMGMAYGRLVALIKTHNQLMDREDQQQDSGVRDATPEEIAAWI